MDYSNFKSKRHKSLEVALFFAIIIIIFGFLIFSEMNKNDSVENTEQNDTDYGWVKWIALLLIIGFIFTKTRQKPTPTTDEEIIKYVADEIYSSKGIYLSTKILNVRVQRGAPEETYVEFLKESFTCLYLNGVGIVERYPGESIKNVKEAKQEDKIQSKLADIGIDIRKDNLKHKNMLEIMGRTEDEE